MFSYRSARSTAFVAGICMVILIETVALHFLMRVRYPVAAWGLTILSLSAVLWLVRDHRALATGAVRLESGTVHLAVGHRFDIRVPVAHVSRAIAPTFRDLPTPGTNQGRDYLNLTKPAVPNVLILLHSPMR